MGDDFLPISIVEDYCAREVRRLKIPVNTSPRGLPRGKFADVPIQSAEPAKVKVGARVAAVRLGVNRMVQEIFDNQPFARCIAVRTHESIEHRAVIHTLSHKLSPFALDSRVLLCSPFDGSEQHPADGGAPGVNDPPVATKAPAAAPIRAENSGLRR